MNTYKLDIPAHGLTSIRLTIEVISSEGAAVPIKCERLKGWGRTPKVSPHKLLEALPQGSLSQWRDECQRRFGVSQSSFYREAKALINRKKCKVGADGVVILRGDVDPLL